MNCHNNEHNEINYNSIDDKCKLGCLTSDDKNSKKKIINEINKTSHLNISNDNSYFQKHKTLRRGLFFKGNDKSKHYNKIDSEFKNNSKRRIMFENYEEEVYNRKNKKCKWNKESMNKLTTDVLDDY